MAKLKVTLPIPTKGEAEAAVRTLLEYIGENPDRAGLKGTPDRVVRYLREATQGYTQSPAEILSKEFPNDESGEVYDGMVIVRDIPFFSLCEHHMITIEGIAHIAYLPGKKVVGISKLARLVDCFAKRLTIQEKMTKQLSSTLRKYLQSEGVAVIIEATHYCMVSRGVSKRGSKTRTCSLTGVFKDSAEVRQEFMFHLS